MRKGAACLAMAAVLVAAISAPAADTEPAAVDDQLITTAASLAQRQAALEAAEKELARKRAELEALQHQIEERIARLETLQKEVAAKTAAIQGLDVTDREFRELVKVYAAMSPSKAAPLLGRMEDDEAARILRALKTDAVAKILPKLDADKAVRLSRLLGLL